MTIPTFDPPCVNGLLEPFGLVSGLRSSYLLPYIWIAGEASFFFKWHLFLF